MRRPCFIGNSHVGAVRKAMLLAQAPYQTGATFAFAPRSDLADCSIDGGLLSGSSLSVATFPERITGRGHVRLEDHRLFVVVGLGLSVSRIADVYRTHRMLEHQEGDRRLISRDCLEATAGALIVDSLAFRLALMLRKETSDPIVLVPEPALSERVLERLPQGEESDRATKVASTLTDPRYGPFLHQVFGQVLQAQAAAASLAAIGQPEDTLTRGVTRLLYQGDVPGDIQHANALYGLRILEDVHARYRDL